MYAWQLIDFLGLQTNAYKNYLYRAVADVKSSTWNWNGSFPDH
jgi:hypothetical protein